MGIELFCAPYIYVLTFLMVFFLSEYTIGQRTPEFEESPFFHQPGIMYGKYLPY